MRLARLLSIVAMVILLNIVSGCGGGGVRVDVNVPNLDPAKSYDSQYMEGWENLRRGKAGRALENFKQSSVADENLYVGFGYAFLVQNKFSLAAQNFQKALDLSPENLQAQLGFAALYEARKDIRKAFNLYSRLRVQFPDNPWVKVRYDYIKSTETEKHLRKAREYQDQGRDDDYISSLKNAALYSPETIDIKIQIAEFFQQKEDFLQAITYYEEILETYPNKEDILFKLAGAFEQMEKYDSAIVIYKKILELKPGDIDISNRINDLKVKFYDMDLPEKFKNIFFKNVVNREDLAALIGHYFDKFLEIRGVPEIITDIANSYAREYIIKVCTLGIMKLRPDHSFGMGDRSGFDVNRAGFAVVMHSLLKFLEREGYMLKFTPLEEVLEPADISPLHKNYTIIKFMMNAQLLKLDDSRAFNPTYDVSPSEAIMALKKILRSIEINE